MLITELWKSNNESDWLNALNKYWDFVLPKNYDIEKKLNNLDTQFINMMEVEDFYNFLHDEYFKWKYTAPNRYVTTTAQLKKYQIYNSMHELKNLHEQLFSFDKNNIKEGLRIATSIRGLGTAGASGLLALLYPEFFATVDQFVVKALREITYLEEIEEVFKINPDNISLKNGEILINIMKRKAADLNSNFKTDQWTPRKIDMILWTYAR